MNSKLFSAILSMDSYNRGYNPGIRFHADTESVDQVIGDAIIISQSDVLAGTSGFQSNFYAVAYDYNGQTIISYRGTDDPTGKLSNDFLGFLDGDLWDGWTIGGGDEDAQQAELAIRFYQDIVEKIQSPGLPNYYNSGIALTGHSLGGGLAGLIGGIYFNQAEIFDNMPFEEAADDTHTSTNLDLRDLAYPGFDYAPNFSKIHATSIDGEVLSALRIAQTTFDNVLDLGNEVDLVPGVDKVAAHSMSLLVTRLYAETEVTQIDWKQAAKYFWPLLYDTSFAFNIGMDVIEGRYNAAENLSSIIAYSAIDNGEATIAARPFGDTGIRAFYNDANDLGRALTLEAAYASTIKDVAIGISKSFVQFAGQMALKQVLQVDHPEVLAGVISLSPDTAFLTINFADSLWRTGLPVGAPALNLQGRIDLLEGPGAETGLIESLTSPDLFKSALRSIYGTSDYTAIDAVTLSMTHISLPSYDLGQIQAPPAPDKANLFVGNIFTNMIVGSNYNDIIVGKGGNNTLIGNLGNDIVFSGVSASHLDGGDGYDVMIADSSQGKVYLAPDLNYVSQMALQKGLGVGSPVTGTPTYTSLDAINNIEKFVLSNQDDYVHFDEAQISFSSASRIHEIDGGGGIDTYFGSGTLDTRSFLTQGYYDISGVKLYNIEKVILQGGTLIADENRNFDFASASAQGLTLNAETIDYSASQHNGIFNLKLLELSALPDQVNINGFVHTYSPAWHNNYIGTNFGDTISITSPLNSLAQYGATSSFILGKGNDSVTLTGPTNLNLTYTGGNDTVNGANGLANVYLAPSILASDVTVSHIPTVSTLLTIAGHGTLNLIYNYNATSYLPMKIWVQGGYIDLPTGQVIGATSTTPSYNGYSGHDTFTDRAGKSVLMNGGGGNDTLYGQDGQDTLFGQGGQDHLYGGTGNDTLTGGLGDDTYHFSIGDGQDTIQEQGDFGQDVIRFGAGINLGNIKLGLEQDGTLTIRYGTTDTITLRQFDLSGAPDWMNAVEEISFADGSALDLVKSGLPVSGLVGDDILYGTRRNDTIRGYGGNDTLSGRDGDDTYIFGTGDGSDTILEQSGSDRIEFMAGITLANIRFEVAYSNLKIYYSPTESVTIYDHYAFAVGGASGTSVENLKLSDGTQINLLAPLTSTGTSGNDTINGSGYHDTILGVAGDDVIKGWGGDDVIEGGAGNDNLSGGLGTDTLSYANASAGVTINLMQVGVAQNTIGAGTDTITADFEKLTASAFADTVTQNNIQVINLGAGNDLLTDNTNRTVSLSTACTYDGGDGTDTLSLDTSPIAATVNLGISAAQLIGNGYKFLANFENVTGSGFNDTLTGDGNINVLRGMNGNDTLAGSGGNDTLEGAAGNDIYSYLNGDGYDTILDTAGSDQINIGVGFVTTDLTSRTSGSDLILTLKGIDVMRVQNHFSGSAVEQVRFSNGAIVTLPSGAATINGTTGNDTLTGTAVNENIYGLAGNDTINGNGGTDNLYGGIGDDTYVISFTTALVIENAAEGTDTAQSSITYTLTKNVENLTLTGSAAINGTGNTANNTLVGNSGANTLDGAAGSDAMTGGNGNDIYVVDAAGDVVTEAASQGTDLVRSSINYTLGLNVENLTLTGAALLNGTGNTLANVLTGNSAANTLTGLDGNDTLDGGAGADTLVGGLGNDTYVVDNVGDVVTESASQGTDTIQSSITLTLGANLENLTLTGTAALNGTGNALANVLTGNSAANTLTGLDGNDTLNGGAGTDTLIGGIGNDTYVVDVATDIITEALNEGTDLVQAASSYTLGNNLENLTLTGTGNTGGNGNALNNAVTGNTGNNTLRGYAGNDTLYGANGTDILYGGDNNDTLQGDGGNDTLYGENGVDILMADAGLDNLYGGANNDVFRFLTSTLDGQIDVIRDYSAAQLDVINIKDLLIGYDPLTKLVTDFVEMTSPDTSTVVRIDRDGTGTAYTWQQIATIQGVTGMTDEAALVTQGRLVVS